MPPQKNPKVDYLRVYPGLNDFSDALEAIPQTVVEYITHIKEVDAKSGSVGSDVCGAIKSYFKNKDTQTLRDLSSKLDLLLPALEQKMHMASKANERVLRQVNRLNADYDMICRHEVPQQVQKDENDPAFFAIVPQEKPINARTQARREAREAREARDARRNPQNSDTRSETPVNTPEPQLNLTSRRRGRVSAAQSAAIANQVSEPQDVAPAGTPAEPRKADQTNDASVYVPLSTSEDHVKAENGKYNRSEAAKVEVNTVPPVVMPLPNGGPEYGSEELVGLKRKRGSVPKSTTEPVYCYCEQGSFGEMVGCDGQHCEREWFHLDCIGLSALPKGQWFCEECRAKLRRR